eukprot:TRINITY_DN1462_c2_g1_i2.p1 TRINITY_DN1462_c2_g1~~TRINITY_DN1462_c2_g1_i2.p1  ORF type:complete len:1143 (+),score=296.94 TRINITY_DN1462_c2_g1_i2:571-3999(+)
MEILKQKTVKSSALLKMRPVWRMYAVAPFVMIYGALLLLSASPEVILGFLDDEMVQAFHIQERHVTWVCLLCIPLFMFFNGLVCLFTYWSAAIRAWAFFDTLPASQIETATHILIRTFPHKGDSTIIKLCNKSFHFQNRLYTWHAASSSFKKPALPINLSMKEYKSTKGRTTAPIEADLSLFGHNRFLVPIPEFKVLMLEHATSPFFVFQMFCVLLWMLDEYWYASLFTGVMLWVFEGTVVQQRLRNITQLREMESRPVVMSVLRDGKWRSVPSYDLLPYDLVLIPKAMETVPCDMLLLEGSVVVNESMLTGESTPLLKESIELREDHEILNVKRDKTHIVFCGTKCLQATGKSHCSYGKGVHGVVGMVLRTGYETSQGTLVRTIINSSTSRVSAGGSEALLFIGCLLMCALASSAYVLYHGLLDEKRSRWKLLLSCTIIITSVVPPELPMELALAVNMSFMQLHKLKIFCTEPFRIPFAGGLDTCCFDKTGTLTADVMELIGLCEDPASKRLEDPAQASAVAHTVVASCHSLVHLHNELAGDSMEVAAVKGAGWSCSGGTTFTNGKRTVRIVSRHAFNSNLKCMSCVVSCGSSLQAVVKGSPEVMRDFYTTVPTGYDEAFEAFGKSGYRVIALGIRTLKCDEAYAKRMKRGDVERDLTFAGFAVFGCPIREDAVPTITALKGASQNVVMITGDNQQTAAWVAREVGIMDAAYMVLRPDHRWEDQDGTIAEPSKKTHLVASGEIMKTLPETWLSTWVTQVKVWARCNPEQKEAIIIELKNKGKTTLMCGDGTNDVGALTQADVGVGLLAGCQSAKPIKAEKGGDAPHPLSVPEALPDDMGFISIIRWKMRENKRRQQYIEHLREEHKRTGKPIVIPPVQEPGLEDEGMYVQVAQLGDASLAAPFTARNSSTKSCCHLLRLGRCTLACTMQMYRVMALNCLNSAFSMSVLAHEGVKFSDTQMTVTSIVATICFLLMSRGVPCKELSKEKPHTRVFTPYVMLTIAAQFAVHLYHLVKITGLVYTQTGDDVLPTFEDFDTAEFQPCLLNSVVFLTTTWQIIWIFVFNYQGEPFMTSLSSNHSMIAALVTLGLIVIECTYQSTSLYYWMEIVDFSKFPELQNEFMSLLVTNCIAGKAIDFVLKLIF